MDNGNNVRLTLDSVRNAETIQMIFFFTIFRVIFQIPLRVSWNYEPGDMTFTGMTIFPKCDPVRQGELGFPFSIYFFQVSGWGSCNLKQLRFLHQFTRHDRIVEMTVLSQTELRRSRIHTQDVPDAYMCSWGDVAGWLWATHRGHIGSADMGYRLPVACFDLWCRDGFVKAWQALPNCEP